MLRRLSVILIATVLFIMPEYALASNQIPRPLYSVEAFKTIYDNATTDNVASVGVTVNMTRYDGTGWGPHLDFPAVFLNVMTTANTREGIHYNSTTDEYSWHNATTDPMLTPLPSSDNTVYGPINLAHPVRYYGGPGDCEYNVIWISTNGWISFCDPMKSAPSAAPIVNFPYQGNPSALVVLYSGYLYPSRGGAIRYGEVTQPSYYANNGVNCFCVSWDGVPDSNGKPQSFQVLIEQIPQNLILYPRQSRIWFQYQQVNINSYFFLGLGDQQGCKAAMCSSMSLQNQTQALLFDQLTTHQVAAYVSNVSVTMSTLGDNTAYTIIDHNENHTRGYNLQMNTSLPQQDPYNTFAGTMAEDGIGLLENVFEIAAPAYAVPGAGIVLGCAFLGYDIWQWASEQLAAAQLFQTDWQTYAIAQAATNNFGTTGSFGHVEARLGMVAYWVFSDVPNNLCNHTLTITATLTYYTMDVLGDVLGTHTLQASVTITMFYPYGNNGFSTAWVMLPSAFTYSNIGYLDGQDPCDFYEVNVPQGYEFQANMYPPSPPDQPASFTITMYDQNKNPVASATNQNQNPIGVYYISSAQGGNCWINVSYNSNSASGYYSLDLWVFPYSSGGGCPFVCPWNGTGYVPDNNLLPGSALSNGTDVSDYYRLEQPLVPTYSGTYFSTYSLRISEFENEHSYLDQAKLTAVDVGKNTNVAVTPTGKVLTYKNPQPSIMAIDQNGKDWYEPLSFIDGNCYQSNPGDSLTLYFGSVNASNARLVLREDPIRPIKDSIHVQLLMLNGSWIQIADIPGRENMSTDILDLSPYAGMMNNPVEVRLCFTAIHKVDYVGLDTTPQTTIRTRQALMISAVHSVYGNVLPQLILKDNYYVQLTPGQYITITFLLPTQNSTETRIFILFLNGHYFTIQK